MFGWKLDLYLTFASLCVCSTNALSGRPRTKHDAEAGSVLNVSDKNPIAMGQFSMNFADNESVALSNLRWNRSGWFGAFRAAWNHLEEKVSRNQTSRNRTSGNQTSKQQNVSSLQFGVAGELERPKERRNTTGGHSYTYREFIEHFGQFEGPKRWKEAGIRKRMAPAKKRQMLARMAMRNKGNMVQHQKTLPKSNQTQHQRTVQINNKTKHPEVVEVGKESEHQGVVEKKDQSQHQGAVKTEKDSHHQGALQKKNQSQHHGAMLKKDQKDQSKHHGTATKKNQTKHHGVSQKKVHHHAAAMVQAKSELVSPDDDALLGADEGAPEDIL